MSRRGGTVYAEEREYYRDGPPPPPPPPKPPRAEATVGAKMATEAAANKAMIVLRNMILLRTIDRSQPPTRLARDSCGFRGS